MSGERNDDQGKKKGKVLTMPDQFQVMPLHRLMKKVMEDDLRQFCIERGLNPDDHMPEWPDD